MVMKTKNLASRKESSCFLLVVPKQSCYKDKDLNKAGSLAQVDQENSSGLERKIAPEEHSFSPCYFPRSSLAASPLRVEVRFRLCTFSARRGASP